MTLWAAFVDIISGALFALAGAFGGNMAAAIAVLSGLVRLALLPLTLRIAYRAVEQQAKLKKIEPELAELRRRYAKDTERLLDETMKLHRRHDIKLADRVTLLGLLVQSPIFMALYSAIKRGLGHAKRYWWIKDLAKPDGILLALTSVMIGITSTLGPNVTAQNRYALFLVSAILTAIMFAKLAAGVMIYTLASSGVGVVQAVLVRRHARRFAN